MVYAGVGGGLNDVSLRPSCSEVEGLRRELILSILTAEMVEGFCRGCTLWSRSSSVGQGDGSQCEGEEGMIIYRASF